MDDDSDGGLPNRNPIFDFIDPDQISDDMDFPPTKDGCKNEKRHMMPSFEPVVPPSDFKIAPHPSETVEANLSADIDVMSKPGWTFPRMDAPTEPGSSGYGASMPQAMSKNEARWAITDQTSGHPAQSSSNSPHLLYDRKTTTLDPETVSMYDEADQDTLEM